jgi:hypothetical protein
MPRTTIYIWRVQIDWHDMPGFLDMLRYDNANVVGWTHVRGGENGVRDDKFIVTLTSSRYTPERWKSFGIKPEFAVS